MKNIHCTWSTSPCGTPVLWAFQNVTRVEANVAFLLVKVHWKTWSGSEVLNVELYILIHSSNTDLRKCNCTNYSSWWMKFKTGNKRLHRRCNKYEAIHSALTSLLTLLHMVETMWESQLLYLHSDQHQSVFLYWMYRQQSSDRCHEVSTLFSPKRDTFLSKHNLQIQPGQNACET